jgi:hypothetical protein
MFLRRIVDEINENSVISISFHARCQLWLIYFVIWMNKSVFGKRKDFTLVHIFFYKCSKI